MAYAGMFGELADGMQRAPLRPGQPWAEALPPLLRHTIFLAREPECINTGSYLNYRGDKRIVYVMRGDEKIICVMRQPRQRADFRITLAQSCGAQDCVARRI